MIATYQYRLLPTRRQHRALEQILESRRQLYNAALEERIDAYRKAKLSLTYLDQSKAPTEWRKSDPEASMLAVSLQRATLKRLDEAYKGFFRRARNGGKAGFPRFRGKGWFDSFGFRQFSGVSLKGARLRFKGMPGSLRLHMHRELPADVSIRNCIVKRNTKGWSVFFAVAIRHHDCPHCGLSIDRDLNAARNILNRAGVGPGLQNVAGCGMRAGENLGSAPRARQEPVASV